MATNPDPVTEKRGVSGYTFAYPGEHDLDGIIRFQRGQCERIGCKPVGVYVDRVYDDSNLVPEHPLVGAEVNLLGSPRFLDENYLLNPKVLAIDPLEIEVSKDDLTLSRRGFWDPNRPSLAVENMSLKTRSNLLTPFKLPFRTILLWNAQASKWWDIWAETAGIKATDPMAYRAMRKECLLEVLASERDPTKRANLSARIIELSKNRPSDRAVFAFGHEAFKSSIPLNGPPQLSSDAKKLGLREDVDWKLELHFFFWDADACLGFTRAVIYIPK